MQAVFKKLKVFSLYRAEEVRVIAYLTLSFYCPLLDTVLDCDDELYSQIFWMFMLSRFWDAQG